MIGKKIARIPLFLLFLLLFLSFFDIIYKVCFEEGESVFRTKLTGWDLLATVMALLLAALIWIPFLHRDAAAVLVITTPEGRTEYALSKEQEITVISRGYTLHIQIQDGAAFVEESDCPNGDCKARGRIRYAGESLLCAPAGVTLAVKGGDGDVDFVAG